jgi:acryloyl-coenzyme A reductase
VIEIAGSPTFSSSLRTLAPGGRLVAVGNVRPGTVPLNPALAILKEIEIVGSGHALVSDLERVINLVSRNLIRPRIAEIVPAAEAARAHERAALHGGTGRIVLAHV